jgi:tetratricopeptide (TPR) repeat protein
MGFRFFRRIKLAPGVTLNLSKQGGSISLGPRGAKYTIGTSGQRATVGLPGTGLFYTTKLDAKSKRGRGAPTLPTSFFERLLTPASEEALIDACKALAAGDEAGAQAHCARAPDLADAAYLAGFIALRHDDLATAEEALLRAWKQGDDLGSCFAKYQFDANMALQVTEELTVHVTPGLPGVLLALAEVYQHQGRVADAIESLHELRRLAPEDVVVVLSLAELLIGEGDDVSDDACREVVEMTGDLGNDTEVHAALMLYKARALQVLGLVEAARDVLTVALRRKKDRAPELLRAARYERGLLYEELGDSRKARADFAKVYAEDPDFEDVADRIGAA